MRSDTVSVGNRLHVVPDKSFSDSCDRYFLLFSRSTGLSCRISASRKRPKSLGHAILLCNVIWYIANNILGDKRWETDHFSLVHDRGSYDGVLLNTFNSLKEDNTLKNHALLDSIESTGWGDEVRLQAADFLAFESFKIVERQRSKRDRRKSMQALLDLDSFAGRASLILPEGLKQI